MIKLNDYFISKYNLCLSINFIINSEYLFIKYFNNYYIFNNLKISIKIILLRYLL